MAKLNVSDIATETAFSKISTSYWAYRLETEAPALQVNKYSEEEKIWKNALYAETFTKSPSK